jgi:hypothetical protein
MVNGQWSTDTGQWSMVNGQWSTDNGALLTDNGQRSMVNGNWSTVNGQLELVNGQRSIPQVGPRMSATWHCVMSLQEELLTQPACSSMIPACPARCLSGRSSLLFAY